MVSDRILTEASGKLTGLVKPQGFSPAAGGSIRDGAFDVNWFAGFDALLLPVFPGQRKPSPESRAAAVDAQRFGWLTFHDIR